MGREAKGGNRVLMTGMRRSGQTDYEINLHGPADCRFPPVRVRMSLGELRQWLIQLRTLPEPDGAARPAPLRIVG